MQSSDPMKSVSRPGNSRRGQILARPLAGFLLLQIMVLALLGCATPAHRADENRTSAILPLIGATNDAQQKRAEMTDEEFVQFVDSAVAELGEKQERLKAEYGIGSHARWHFDQETEKLDFFDEQDRKVLEMDVIDIGSWASNSKTWMWAWANVTVLPSLRMKAERLKELDSVTGVEIFSEEAAFPLEDEGLAWSLAAMSVRHLNALGVYRAPSSARPLVTFLAITRIQRLPARPPSTASPEWDLASRTRNSVGLEGHR